MNEYDESVDFVIVGSGGGSLCAALYLVSQGKSVAVLEKASYAGGTTARSGGVMWIPNNPFLKRDGVDDSFEKAALYLDGLAAEFEPVPGSTEIRRHTYLREAPEMIEFLLSKGVKLDRAYHWPDYYDERPGGLSCGRSVLPVPFNVNELGEWKNKMRPGFLELPLSLEEGLILPYFKRSGKSRIVLLKLIGRVLVAVLTGKKYVTAGKALQARTLQALLNNGGTVRLDSPVSELLMEGDEVKGVLTVRQGKPWRIAARLGVLVGAGGFSHNQRMRDQYQPGTQTKWSSALTTDTGEMIEEMMRKGAAVAQMNEMVGNQCIIVSDNMEGEIQSGAQMVTAKPHAILVDQSGQRYMNEGGSYMAYCQGILKRHESVPAIPSWAVFDSQFMQKYMLAGTMPGSKKPDSWFEKGFVKRAESIEELAGLMNIDPVALRATVDRFNGFVENNRDEDFHRGEREYDRWLGDPLQQPNPSLGKIERGPFYATCVYPGDVGTYGGVVSDECARVLREDGSVIKGLYATGISTASVMGRVYPGAGASVGPSYTWGYVAAKHALASAG